MEDIFDKDLVLLPVVLILIVMEDTHGDNLFFVKIQPSH